MFTVGGSSGSAEDLSMPGAGVGVAGSARLSEPLGVDAAGAGDGAVVGGGVAVSAGAGAGAVVSGAEVLEGAGVVADAGAVAVPFFFFLVVLAVVVVPVVVGVTATVVGLILGESWARPDGAGGATGIALGAGLG